MNMTSRKTRACTLDTLDEALKNAIRSYAAKYGLDDVESDVLMCCETLSVRPTNLLLGGIKTTLSAVYVTPKWLVWADSSGGDEAAAGTAELSQIDVCDHRATTQYAITADQGLNITGRYTDKNRTGFTFIVLEAEADGQKFRDVLHDALSKTAR